MNREEYINNLKYFMDMLVSIDEEYKAFNEIINKSVNKNIRISVITHNKMSEVLREIDNNNKNKEDYYHAILFYFYTLITIYLSRLDVHLPDDNKKITNIFGKIKKEVIDELKLFNEEYEIICNTIFEIDPIEVMDTLDKMISTNIDIKTMKN